MSKQARRALNRRRVFCWSYDLQLSQYITDTQSLLHDNLGLLTPVSQLTTWINEARRQVAYGTGCVNLLATGLAPNGNAATPGFMVPGGLTPGSQFMPPFRTIVNQEKYPFSMALAQIQNANAGVEYVTDISSLAISWGSMRPALNYMPWDDFQAYARSYNYIVSSYPLVWATDGDGANANVWLWPVPSQALEMEWQCRCTPAPLVTDSDFDSIPHPFQNCVKFFAAYLAKLGTQQPQQAGMYLQLFQSSLLRGRGATEHGRITDWYNGSGY
jgi:hypothetical protein